jgi:hypothetical protein
VYFFRANPDAQNKFEQQVNIHVPVSWNLDTGKIMPTWGYYPYCHAIVKGFVLVSKTLKSAAVLVTIGIRSPNPSIVALAIGTVRHQLPATEKAI